MQKKQVFACPESSGLVPLPSMRYIFIAFALYVLYKLVFDLIIPVSRATSQVRGQMRKMQEMQQEQFAAQQQQAQPNYNQQRQETAPVKPSKDDYLDFEEIK